MFEDSEKTINELQQKSNRHDMEIKGYKDRVNGLEKMLQEKIEELEKIRTLEEENANLRAEKLMSAFKKQTGMDNLNEDDDMDDMKVKVSEQSTEILTLRDQLRTQMELTEKFKLKSEEFKNSTYTPVEEDNTENEFQEKKIQE